MHNDDLWWCGCKLLHWGTFAQKCHCIVRVCVCVFVVVVFVYWKPLLRFVGLLRSAAVCPNCAFALLHGHVCLWCHFTGSSQPLLQSLVRCMSMKECHCVFVQSCSWTTVLSLGVLMPVPLPPPPRVSSLPRCLSMWSWLDLELLVGCRLSTGLTLISVSYCFHAQNVLRVFVWFFFSLPVVVILLYPTCCSCICVLLLCQTHQSSARSNQHRSRWWRMTWQPSHCWSQLTQRRSPAFGCIAGRSWSKVSHVCVMAL